MADKIAELSRYRMDKAKDDLAVAATLFELGKYAQSLNRSYYSMFHATRALLALDRYDSKKHSGIISYFNQCYIKTGKIDVEYSKMLMAAQNLRNDSDYDDFYLATKEDAEQQLENAKEYLDFLGAYICKIIFEGIS